MDPEQLARLARIESKLDRVLTVIEAVDGWLVKFGPMLEKFRDNPAARLMGARRASR